MTKPKGSKFSQPVSIYATRIATGLTKLETAQARRALMELVPADLRSIPSAMRPDGTYPEPTFPNPAAERKFLAAVGPNKLIGGNMDCTKHT